MPREFLPLPVEERAAAERQVQQIHRSAARHSDADQNCVVFAAEAHRVIVDVLCNDVF